MNGGTGNDTISTGSGIDTLIGGTGASNLFGGAGNDLYVVSEAGRTLISDASGVDTVEMLVSILSDIRFIDKDFDTLSPYSIDDLVIYHVGDTTNLVNAVSISNYLNTSYATQKVETLRDSTGALLTLSTVLGDNGNNTVTMTNTKYYAFGGNDSVTGNTFNNEIYGGLGNDTLTGVGGSDTIFGGTGVDTLSGGAGNDSMDGGADNDFFDGGAGFNTLIGGGGNDAYFHNGTGQSYIIDSSGTDTLYITTADLGDMQYSSIVDNNADGIDDDLVIYFTSAALSANDRTKAVIIKDFDINATNRVEVIVDAQNDQQSGTLATFGTNDDDTITGTSGNELVHGFQGNDLVNGGAGNDTVIGWTGNDTAYGDDGNDSLLGGAGADSIFGGTGNDYISSSSSNDVLHGGDGLDTMLGGDGLDTLTESSAVASDRIQTFDATDIINVDALNFTGIAYGASADSNPLVLRYYNTTSRTYVVDDSSSFSFYVDGVWALNASDFVF